MCVGVLVLSCALWYSTFVMHLGCVDVRMSEGHGSNRGTGRSWQISDMAVKVGWTGGVGIADAW